MYDPLPLRSFVTDMNAWGHYRDTGHSGPGRENGNAPATSFHKLELAAGAVRKRSNRKVSGGI